MSGTLTPDAQRAIEFVRRVRELCDEFKLTLVAPEGGVFHLGILTSTFPPKATRIGSLKHISPYFAELDPGSGVYMVIK